MRLGSERLSKKENSNVIFQKRKAVIIKSFFSVLTNGPRLSLNIRHLQRDRFFAKKMEHCKDWHLQLVVYCRFTVCDSTRDVEYSGFTVISLCR